MAYPLWARACILPLTALAMALAFSCTNASDGIRYSTDQYSKDRPFVSLDPDYGETPSFINGGFQFGGPTTLEENIAQADVIVRARMQSVAAVVTTVDQGNHEVWLEFNFNALEYLKGTGATQINAVVRVYVEYDTAIEARAAGPASLALHDSQWDNRDAILFLWNAHGVENSAKLHLGYIGPTNGPHDDIYSIASQIRKKWLPATDISGANRTSGTNDPPAFLLDLPPTGGGGGAWGQSGGTPTITLGALKAKIAAIDQEVVAGDGSEAYAVCIAYKYSRQREVQRNKEAKFPDGGYYYRRSDGELGSGQPAGSRAFTSDGSKKEAEAIAAGATPRSEPRGLLKLLDNDADLFTPTTGWPRYVQTNRPLVAGVYRFFYGYVPQVAIICNGAPEEELKRQEVFVTVSAPEGTVHEAFFDPIATGNATGYFNAGDALSDADFTVGTDNTAVSIQSLKHQGNVVTLEISPYRDLAGLTLDFLALNGSTALTLATSGATHNSEAGTLTWSVTSAPWEAGDLLMLRIRGNDAS